MARYTLGELAALTESKLTGDENHLITGVENLDAASSHEAAFLENPRYEKQLATSQAGVIFIHPSIKPIPGRNFLVNPHPSLVFQKVIELFIHSPLSGFTGIHPTAVIHPTAQLSDSVTIGPYAIVDRGVKIGKGTLIGAHVFIGAETVIGSDCLIYPHVIIREGCEIGHRVILQPGAVIGADGFGYFTDSSGKHTLLKQKGKVVIEDDVEIGSNTTIDRARFKETRIGRGTKMDNLVQIGHQVKIGEDNMIVSQVGIAGSTTTGRNVVMGGQAGVVGHIEIGNGVILAARSGVSKSLLQPGIYGGEPAMPAREASEFYVNMRNIGKWIKRIKEIEEKVSQINKVSSEKIP